ncbi:ATP-dependent helicase fft2 [Penicillium cataractarum]|uniref:DNA helicase n=1 Tax=Penicillium cataractarum TaxID=2100454 RepID=A0A9W9SG15_9EURO|nr:ATP-dependent helicase fft2 [Penicillium cataractarum]KAJ5377340.1 ATP-dependent helicase fft2 [Penicillium cataractarum]
MDDSVPDTPIRGRKPAPGTPDEDGDYETIATLPAHTLTPSQRLTQATQLVDMPYSHPNTVIQVAASSPMAPAASPPTHRAPRGGLLSSLMAPSGTSFRPPVTTVRPTKRTPNFDMDDGPTYRGGSSDDDENRMDIKPAMFEKTARSPEKVAESPVRAESRSLDRFKEITSSAMYDPTAPGMKRSADQMSPADAPRGVATKKLRQAAPSRAQPVTAHISTVQDITDFRIRVKVERILKVMPTKSVPECVEALMAANGNYDMALDLLANEPARANGNGTRNAAIEIESSDDELNAEPVRNMGQTAKQNIKARGTIQDKWAASSLPGAFLKEDEVKPRGRLMRGRKRNSPALSDAIIIDSDDDSLPTKKPRRLQNGPPRARSLTPEAVLTDSDDSDVIDENASAGDLDQKVLRFFNTCQPHDLADIASIPQETAELITSQRPFTSLGQVREVSAPVDENAKPKGKGRGRKPPKPIGDKIVDKCLDMWTGYLAIDALVAECEALGKPVAEEMKKWGVDIFGKRGDAELELMNLSGSHDSGIATPSSSHQSPDEDDSDDEIRPVVKSRKSQSSGQSGLISQPSIMSKNLVLKDYQIVGLNWLALLYEKKMSCILADEMGLGKTVQVISFLSHLYEKDIKGPHLVVVPSSTLENWLREFKNFSPKLKVQPYYARHDERASLRDQLENDRDSINVVVTTYTIAKAKVDSKFLREMDFSVCVYDEGHMLKNSQSLMYDKLIRIKAEFRLLLTGTPLQNNLQELASLLGFMLPGVFRQHKDDLQAVFANKAKTSDESHATLLSAQRIERAKSMLKPFVLRRKKTQVIDLPAKHSYVEYCDMKPSQRDIYDHEKDQVRQLLEDRAAGKKTGSKSANILMKLRQAAIHPLLARRHYTDAILKKMAKSCLKEDKWALSDPAVIEEELQAYNDYECHNMCLENPNSLGKYKLKNEEWMDSGKVEKLRELLTRFVANGDRTLVFSQFTMVMDILENVLETLQMDFVRLDGRTNVQDRQSILDAFHDRKEIPVFLLSTKAGGAGINLACANKIVIFDSSFNPQEDVQAENRAHRVGQTRDVEVFRFVTRETIEEQIYALGQTKLALDQAVAGDDDGAGKKTEEAGMKAVESMVLADIEKKETVEEEK